MYPTTKRITITETITNHHRNQQQKKAANYKEDLKTLQQLYDLMHIAHRANYLSLKPKCAPPPNFADYMQTFAGNFADDYSVTTDESGSSDDESPLSFQDPAEELSEHNYSEQQNNHPDLLSDQSQEFEDATIQPESAISEHGEPNLSPLRSSNPSEDEGLDVQSDSDDGVPVRRNPNEVVSKEQIASKCSSAANAVSLSESNEPAIRPPAENRILAITPAVQFEDGESAEATSDAFSINNHRSPAFSEFSNQTAEPNDHHTATHSQNSSGIDESFRNYNPEAGQATDLQSNKVSLGPQINIAQVLPPNSPLVTQSHGYAVIRELNGEHRPGGSPFQIQNDHSDYAMDTRELECEQSFQKLSDATMQSDGSNKKLQSELPQRKTARKRANTRYPEAMLQQPVQKGLPPKKRRKLHDNSVEPLEKSLLNTGANRKRHKKNKSDKKCDKPVPQRVNRLKGEDTKTVPKMQKKKNGEKARQSKKTRKNKSQTRKEKKMRKKK